MWSLLKSDSRRNPIVTVVLRKVQTVPINWSLCFHCRRVLLSGVNEGDMADHTPPLESGQLLSPDLPILASPPPPAMVNGDGHQQVQSNPASVVTCHINFNVFTSFSTLIFGPTAFLASHFVRFSLFWRCQKARAVESTLVVRLRPADNRNTGSDKVSFCLVSSVLHEQTCPFQTTSNVFLAQIDIETSRTDSVPSLQLHQYRSHWQQVLGRFVSLCFHGTFLYGYRIYANNHHHLEPEWGWVALTASGDFLVILMVISLICLSFHDFRRDHVEPKVISFPSFPRSRADCQDKTF